MWNVTQKGLKVLQMHWKQDQSDGCKVDLLRGTSGGVQVFHECRTLAAKMV